VRTTDRGQTVGWWTDSSGTGNGFLLQYGIFTTIDVPGEPQRFMFGNNDSGQIVGAYLDSAGIQHGFLATPQSRIPNFTTASLIVSQTMRVNLVAPAGNACMAQVAFADVNGNAVGSSTSVNLSPGQAAFLDRPGDLVAAAGKRAQVRPVLAPVAGPPPSSCQTTVEVYNNANGFNERFDRN
jgi:hypothetical protein